MPVTTRAMWSPSGFHASASTAATAAMVSRPERVSFMPASEPVRQDQRDEQVDDQAAGAEQPEGGGEFHAVIAHPDDGGSARVDGALTRLDAILTRQRQARVTRRPANDARRS
ncbi:hypothetical protein GCM10009710_33980 [Aeromicrobium alkaliterrae]|uniref:Uncharacterized protein n=1 Tax=Aeromicrobium alkaliterrae TaxID=302168 RepID=A0ABN2KA09_9ACTN